MHRMDDGKSEVFTVCGLKYIKIKRTIKKIKRIVKMAHYCTANLYSDKV